MDLDEIPDRVVSLLREAIEQFEDTHNSLHQTANKLDGSLSIVEACHSMDNIRKRLMKLDTRLEDCQALLAGYQRACADMSQPPNLEKEQQPLDTVDKENE